MSPHNNKIIALVALSGWALAWKYYSLLDGPQALDWRYYDQNHHPSEMMEGENRITLPDWFLTTECSVYSIDCVSHEIRTGFYAPYPFPLINDKLNASSTTRGENIWKDPATFPVRMKDPWADPPTEAKNIMSAPSESSSKCVERARTATMKEQLDRLLPSKQKFWEGGGGGDKRIAFTISDKSYSNGIDDVFEMAHGIMGLEYYFLVAIDQDTIKMACDRAYPVLGYVYSEGGGTKKKKKEEEEEEEGEDPKPEKKEEAWAYDYKGKQKVANVAMSKWKVALEILQRGYPVFFFEMDVWFLRSPVPLFRDQKVDAMFGAHQDNPDAINIGVYSVLPTRRSVDFFRASISLFQQRPSVHDQFVMHQILRWAKQPDQTNLQYATQWGKNVWGDDPPPIPEFKNGYVTHDNFPSWAIASAERPVVSDHTVAIHVLCGMPLTAPHGKQQIAKEMGVWVGSNGYYDDGEARYLWMDGHIHNAVSFTMHYPGREPFYQYHNYDRLKWLVSCTIALANHTNRIWVMPKVANDRGFNFLWMLLDMQSVEEFVRIRETTFPSNPRSWISSRRYDVVSRIAISDGDKGPAMQLYRQLDAWPTGTTGAEGWHLRLASAEDAMDSWFTLAETAEDSRVLLAGLPAANGLLDRMVKIHERKRRNGAKLDLSVPAQHIVHVYRNLKWCLKSFDDEDLMEKVSSSAIARDDCYGRGNGPP